MTSSMHIIYIIYPISLLLPKTNDKPANHKDKWQTSIGWPSTQNYLDQYNSNAHSLALIWRALMCVGVVLDISPNCGNLFVDNFEDIIQLSCEILLWEIWLMKANNMGNVLDLLSPNVCAFRHPRPVAFRCFPSCLKGTPPPRACQGRCRCRLPLLPDAPRCRCLPLPTQICFALSTQHQQHQLLPCRHPAMLPPAASFQLSPVPSLVSRRWESQRTFATSRTRKAVWESMLQCHVRPSMPKPSEACGKLGREYGANLGDLHRPRWVFDPIRVYPNHIYFCLMNGVGKPKKKTDRPSPWNDGM